MKVLPVIKTLPPTVREEILEVYKQISALKDNADHIARNFLLEKLADLINQAGLHDDSRKYYSDVIEHASSRIEKSRLLRKLSASHAAQRNFIKAQIVSEEALAVLQQADPANINVADLFEALAACAFANYGINNSKRLKALIKEMRVHFSSITDKALRLRFYFVVMLDILHRHRWYMLPEEAITHGEFYLQHALESENWNAIASAYGGLGFVHLWREEFALSRKYFEKAMDILQNRNFDLVLTSQVYMTVSYRMQNNLSMTEAWSAISIDVAKKTRNEDYLAISYSNLAWVYVKRNNWLYAEEYARKSIEQPLSICHPFIYLCIFPLLACFNKNQNLQEAGKYCYFLLHPQLKELPATIYKKLELMNFAWLNNNADEMKICLDDVITEAELTNYF